MQKRATCMFRAAWRSTVWICFSFTLLATASAGRSRQALATVSETTQLVIVRPDAMVAHLMPDGTGGPWPPDYAQLDMKSPLIVNGDKASCDQNHACPEAYFCGKPELRVGRSKRRCYKLLQGSRGCSFDDQCAGDNLCYIAEGQQEGECGIVGKTSSGEFCTQHIQCEHSNCRDNRCSQPCSKNNSCPPAVPVCHLKDLACERKGEEHRFCKWHGTCKSEISFCDPTTKRCRPKSKANEYCGIHEQCETLFCHPEKNSCEPQLEDKMQCQWHNQCQSSFCRDSPSAKERFCFTRLAFGQSCDDDTACKPANKIGVCIDSKCQGGRAGDRCFYDYDCRRVQCTHLKTRDQVQTIPEDLKTKKFCMRDASDSGDGNFEYKEGNKTVVIACALCGLHYNTRRELSCEVSATGRGLCYL